MPPEVSSVKLPTYQALLCLVRAHGGVIFQGGWNLNLVLLRRTPGDLDAWDDLLCAAYWDGSGVSQLTAWPCTADPGRPSIEHPRRRDGTAQLCAGQHRGGFTFGTHRGLYRCLVATRPLPVLRYHTAEDFAAGHGSVSQASGIQVHRAGQVETGEVGPWSEGCIVLQHAADLDALLGLCDAQVLAQRGNTFTLTVIPWAG